MQPIKYQLNRTPVIVEILEKIVGKNPNTLSSMSLVGVSTVGKTNVLKTLVETDKRDELEVEKQVTKNGNQIRYFYISAYGYFSQAGKAHFGDKANVIEVLAAELKELVNETNDVTVDSDNEMDAKDYLNAVFTAYKDKAIHLILLIDDFDYAFNSMSIDEESLLYGLFDKENENFHAVITATTRSFADLVKSYGHGHRSELAKHLEHYRMPMLPCIKINECLNQIADYEGLELKPYEIDFFTRVSGGHAGLLATILKSYKELGISLDQETFKANESNLIESFLAEESCKEIFAEIWTHLTDKEEDAMLLLAKRGWVRDIDAAKQLQAMQLISGNVQLRDIPNESQKQLVFDGRIDSDLFRDYIRFTHEETETDNQTESEEHLLDTLRTEDRRIMMHLLANKGKVCKYAKLYWIAFRDSDDNITHEDDYHKAVEGKEEDYRKHKLELAISRIRSRLKEENSEGRLENLKVDTVRGRGFKVTNL